MSEYDQDMSIFQLNEHTSTIVTRHDSIPYWVLLRDTAGRGGNDDVNKTQHACVLLLTNLLATMSIYLHIYGFLPAEQQQPPRGLENPASAADRVADRALTAREREDADVKRECVFIQACHALSTLGKR